MNEKATIKFNASVQGDIKLEIFDALGNLVSVATVPAGVSQFDIDGVNNAGSMLATGSYKVRLSSGSYNAVAPLVIVR